MKIIFIISISILFTFNGLSQQVTTKKTSDSKCVKYYKKIESDCEKGGYTYFFTNTCLESLDVFYAIEKINGNWSTGVYPSLKSSKTFDVIVCQSSDVVVYLTRKPGSNVKFPQLKELKEKYSTRL